MIDLRLLMQLLSLSLNFPNEKCAVPASYCKQISVIRVDLRLRRELYYRDRVGELMLDLVIACICRYAHLLLTAKATTHAAAVS